ncbi:MAG: hypothetical protein HFF26_02080 [Oscillospiraceae bacterium]|nr:hypothetical protein [Oscillospiraceae bacterium]
MSIWSALRGAYSYEDAFGAKDCTSQAMREAIREWRRLYYEREATEEYDPCQRIAYTIVNKLTKTAFGEYKADGGDGFTQAVLGALGAVGKQAMQRVLIGGEAWLKPVPGPGGFVFTVVGRDNVLVFGRDGQGVPTDIGLVERTAEERSFYTLLERRMLDRRGRLTIRNQLYRSDLPEVLGSPVSLKALARYEALPEEYTFPEPLGGLGLARLITPMENCVDGSQDGVSVYAPAVGLIHNVDRNEALLNGEFERGQSRIIASADLLKKGRDGRRRLDDRLFVGVDDDPQEVGLTIFSPELREQSFLARKQSYLRAAESIIGLKRGLLSEVEEVERTAREITSSAGDYNLTIIDFQQMFEAAAREAVRLCGLLGSLYRVRGARGVDGNSVSIDWGNGILYDEDKTWADYLDLVGRGLLKPEIALGWRFGMPAETEQDLAAIRAKYMPPLERLADGEE